MQVDTKMPSCINCTPAFRQIYVNKSINCTPAFRQIYVNKSKRHMRHEFKLLIASSCFMSTILLHLKVE